MPRCLQPLKPLVEIALWVSIGMLSDLDKADSIFHQQRAENYRRFETKKSPDSIMPSDNSQRGAEFTYTVNAALSRANQ